MYIICLGMDMWVISDLKNGFENEWYGFTEQLVALKDENDETTEVTMELGSLRKRLPYCWTQQ